MPATPQQGDDLWFSRQQAAKLCGVSTKTFDDSIRPLIPADAVKGAGAKLRYFGPAFVAALVRHRQKVDADGKVKPEEAMPNLERIRDYKAQLVEMDVQTRRGELVQLEKVKRAIAGGFVAFRGTGDQLVRRFGNDAGDLFNEGVAEFEHKAIAVLNDVSTG
jgi:hypothetical protein